MQKCWGSISTHTTGYFATSSQKWYQTDTTLCRMHLPLLRTTEVRWPQWTLVVPPPLPPPPWPPCMWIHRGWHYWLKGIKNLINGPNILMWNLSWWVWWGKWQHMMHQSSHISWLFCRCCCFWSCGCYFSNLLQNAT